jgi:hypothetical protein
MINNYSISSLEMHYFVISFSFRVYMNNTVFMYCCTECVSTIKLLIYNYSYYSHQTIKKLTIIRCSLRPSIRRRNLKGLSMSVTSFITFLQQKPWITQLWQWPWITLLQRWHLGPHCCEWLWIQFYKKWPWILLHNYTLFQEWPRIPLLCFIPLLH